MKNLLEDRTEIRVYRKVTVQTERVLKGSNMSEIEIRSYGGEKDGFHDLATESPDFKPEESVLLFLEKLRDDYVLKGAKYGKYSIENGEIRRKEDVASEKKLSLNEAVSRILR